MKELRADGHVKVVAEREHGRVKQWVYTIHESPDVEIQQVEIQQVENHTLNNTDSTNTQEEAANDPIQNLFMFYTQEIGLLTPLIADALEDWQKDVPEKWIRDAITEAVKANARNSRYAEAILKRWKAQGSQEPAKKPTRTNAAKPKQKYDQPAPTMTPEEVAEMFRADGLIP